MLGMLYPLRRHRLGAFSLLHWISILCLACAALIVLDRFGIHRIWSYPFLVLAVFLPIVDYLAYRQDYVSFTPGPQVSGARPLSAQTQLKVRATGLFEVEGKYRRHTWLEASYRTFPSREHAVIAICQPSTLLRICHSRSQDNGMWYIFCMPRALKNIQMGQIQFGRKRWPAVAMTHSLEVPGRIRRRRSRIQNEVVYLSCELDSDAALVAGDLQVECESGHPEEGEAGHG